MSVLQQNRPIRGMCSPVGHGQVEQRSFGVGQHHPTIIFNNGEAPDGTQKNGG
jgi:hypothetical protein